MQEYEFTLNFLLADAHADPADCVERLHACDDAIIGIGAPGRISLSFTRTEESARAAVLSALSDVVAAVPGARLVEASPDLVGLTEAAELLGCSRQYVRKLMVESKGAFPAPVHQGKAGVWRLAEILDWLRTSGKMAVDDALLGVADAAMQCNLARAQQRLVPDFRAQIEPAVLA